MGIPRAGFCCSWNNTYGFEQDMNRTIGLDVGGPGCRELSDSVECGAVTPGISITKYAAS